MTTEEKLDLIIEKLDELIKLTKKINKDTEDSFENDGKEILYNVIGDIIGNILIPEKIE